MSDAPSPWFRDGLRFSCTQCGKCCTGSPGYVWIEDKEIDAMAAFLNVSKEGFVKKYTRSIGHRLSLLEDRRTFDCIFLKEGKCTVYAHRPKQCRTFPWWPENVASQQGWREAAKRCEGIEHADAPLLSAEEILAHLT